MKDKNKQINHEKKLVLFTLFNEKMGIDISYVREVLAPLEIHPLPNTPDFVEGVINLRDHIITVIDLRKKFTIKTNFERKANFRILVCKIKNYVIGLIVDNVNEVITLNKENYESMPSFISSLNDGNHIQGVVNVEGTIITVLDIDYILSNEEQVKLAQLKNDS